MGKKARRCATNGLRILHSIDSPKTEEEMHTMIDKIAVVPRDIYLSRVDIGLTVAEFAEDFAYEIFDATKIFHSKNASSVKVCKCLSLLVERSKQHKSTLHLVRMTEHNVESMVMADIFFQYTDVLREQTDGLVIGKHLLHAFCIMNGETVRLYDVKHKSVVRSVIKQFEPDAECSICLEHLMGLSTCLPFACGHAICTSCFTPDLKACPACRDKRSWKSLSLFSVKKDECDACANP